MYFITSYQLLLLKIIIKYILTHFQLITILVRLVSKISIKQTRS